IEACSGTTSRSPEMSDSGLGYPTAGLHKSWSGLIVHLRMAAPDKTKKPSRKVPLSRDDNGRRPCYCHASSSLQRSYLFWTARRASRSAAGARARRFRLRASALIFANYPLQRPAVEGSRLQSEGQLAVAACRHQSALTWQASASALACTCSFRYAEVG